ncbi:MAG: hypothetical protein ACI406_07995, partial [Victivallis vadensis]
HRRPCGAIFSSFRIPLFSYSSTPFSGTPYNFYENRIPAEAKSRNFATVARRIRFVHKYE